VKEQSGIELEFEIKLVGFDNAIQRGAAAKN
jgi:hypothetical protein